MAASSSSRRELQGPRPPPLTVNKASWKVKKSAGAAPASRGREPVVVYLNTPKVIHARPQDFMSLVQRLTGKPSAAASSSSSSAGGSGRRSNNLDSPTAAAAAAAAGQDGVGSGGGGDGDPLLLTLGQLSNSLSSVPSPIISPSLFFCSPSAQASLQDLSPLF